jgi:hypothetical protein
MATTKATTTTPKERTGRMPAPAAPPATEYTPADDAAIGTPDWLIARAFELENERFELQEKVSANRRTLRDLDKQGALSKAQSAWLNVFYSLKVQGTTRDKDANEATRRAREHARKNGKAS